MGAVSQAGAGDAGAGRAEEKTAGQGIAEHRRASQSAKQNNNVFQSIAGVSWNIREHPRYSCDALEYVVVLFGAL